MTMNPKTQFPSLGHLAALGLLTLALPLAGCGGGGGSDGPPSHRGPDLGSGSLFILDPTDTGDYQTDRPTVALQGDSFRPTGTDCNTVLPSSYLVSWSNSSTAATGNAFRQISCFLFPIPLIDLIWSADSIPLAMGANSITVTAVDGAGNVGRDTIVVTRLPDTTPPTVVSVSPINGATGVGVNTSVVVTFSEAMDPSTVNTTTITLIDGAKNPVPAAVTYFPPSVITSTANLTASNPLAFNTTYQAMITTGVRDAAGNALAAPYTFSFTTGP